jgi:hypothetical protein
MDGSDPESGQVAPLLALFAVAIGLACLGLGRFAAGGVDAARARTAADAAALAGAVDGEAAAREAAVANGGAVESYESAGTDVRVRARVGAHAASARARRTSDAFVNAQARMSGSTFTNGLAPALRAAVVRAAQLLGRPIPITSGFRTGAEQRALWSRRTDNPYPVAAPGTSMHERGLAIDVPAGLAAELAVVGPRAGLCQRYPRTDPVHFELCDRRLPLEGAG